jgi:ferric-dicitrate binding protein FerR (iron transport regulator)
MSEERIKNEASRWLIELDTAPTIGAALWNDFEAWIQKDPRHRATYIRMEEAWRAMDELADSMKARRAPVGRLARVRRGLQRLRSHPRVLIGVLALVVATGLVWFVYG